MIATADCIALRGARQNNLKNLDLDLPHNQLIVVTGVSGSGKSSLVFDTLYAEGQRRYVETFSPYARQFLDRMDKPRLDRLEGMPPAIAIDQVNPVRTSRSTVGTMTEINDHLKLLYARAATLHCRSCGEAVRRESAESIGDTLLRQAAAAGDPRLLICFSVEVPKRMPVAEIRAELERQGYTRLLRESANELVVIQDRLRVGTSERARVIESLEAAQRAGHGRISVHRDTAGDDVKVTTAGDAARSGASPTDAGGGEPWRYSTGLHCARCDLDYQDATPGLFSFNSPVGACEHCKGFGRVIGIDYGLVVPDEGKSLAGGALRPWQTPSYKECQDDLLRFATQRGVPVDRPWRELTAEQRRWVIEGEGEWTRKLKHWYGARRFFDWLESKAYRMHIRVLLSKYRSYTPCPACGGARLKPDALLWRLGANPSLAIHELQQLPIAACRRFIEALPAAGAQDEAMALLHGELRARLGYLCEVGLDYLTLDRQSRTLSGGEVQRINLTTALGTSLVNTLFVLDEPSIGLHPRDIGRIVTVMQRLRDAGNSLLIVEHDPAVMRAADLLIDLGPGAGERGGEIVAMDTPAAIAAHPKSLTGAWLAGRRRLPPAPATRKLRGSEQRLQVTHATLHNLRDLGFELPLNRLVCVTGVSGSGKSTLVQDLLYPALRKRLGKPAELTGSIELGGDVDAIGDLLLVDQAPIGRTTRSNPASYVGAFDEIRALFAATPDAKLSRYTAGTFSFNSGTGRCPQCSGNGFEHIEMQFLSDVYLRCEACDGKRYRAETLAVRVQGPAGRSASISDVLAMTVTEALAFFSNAPKLRARLQPLADVGLDYLQLGQPVPTLSGGEAQRLKLAGHLVEAAEGRASAKLLIFDEPTTGLHFEDVARLMGAFDKLLDAGHSLLVIEHHLDVVRRADWVVDLGPEGGDGGGQLVYSGPVAGLLRHKGSHTAEALRADATPVVAGAVAEPRPARRDDGHISVRGAREHNLRNIDVEIPRDRFTVVTGVSGSGKSTLAFDIVFNEGQRRYLESLNAYARQFVQPASRADVDAVHGIPPTVAIEQRASRGGLRSTVATLTGLHHFLRILYVHLGVQFCPDCQVAIEPQSAAVIAAQLRKRHGRRGVQLLAPLVARRKGIYTDLARWAAARGARELRVDGAMVPSDPFPKLKRYVEHTVELPVAELDLRRCDDAELLAAIESTLSLGQGMLLAIGADGHSELHSARRSCPGCRRGFPEPDPRLLSFNSPQGWCPECKGTGVAALELPEEQTGEENAWLEERHDTAACCPACEGARLNPVARNLRFAGQSIVQLGALTSARLADWSRKLRLDARASQIARDALGEIQSRLSFLERVGLGYLSLDRSAPTLSGGEAQRIRLAAQLGANLRGVCYVLDEPSIGLHPRDNRKLLDALSALAAQANTLLVVEHDEETIERADHVIDLGPGAGVAGGRVVATGTAAELRRNPASLTGRMLQEPLRHDADVRRPVTRSTPQLRLRGANLHNLRDLDVSIPLQRLVAISGVSGSGKSTLARDVLYENLHRSVGERRPPPLVGLRAVEGAEVIRRVLEVDQTPIGRTPRSCPATYVGFWDDIRRLYAGSNEARARGYSASRFSFNTAGGRCPECEGQGQRTIEMNFLPDVKVRCDRCGGARFDRETRAVLWNGLSISDVLALDVDAALKVFAAQPRIRAALALLAEVGLGYLTLGQSSATLSGGEAQRLKLVTELARLTADRRGDVPHTLYVLDEPTVGLHMADVARLIAVLHRLVAAGHSLLVIEHNLDVLAAADWIIDLGPEAGEDGGRVVAAGTPTDVAARAARSHTGAALREFLRQRAKGARGAARA